MDCWHIFQDLWTDRQKTSPWPCRLHNNLRQIYTKMVCIYHLWQSTPFDWCMLAPPRWRCMSSCQIFLFFCTIAEVSHCVFWGNVCQFHDQELLSCGPRDTHKEVWYSFCICLSLGRVLHSWEPLDSFGSLLKSILVHLNLTNSLWCTHVSHLGPTSFPRRQDMRFQIRILWESYLESALRSWDTFHQAHRIARGTFKQTMHSHIRIRDLSCSHFQRTFRDTPVGF